MRYRSMLVSLLFVLLGLPTALAQQDAPPQIDAALLDLSAQVGIDVALDDLTSYTFEAQQFNDTSLGCPAPDQTYAQVITPGYQFTLVYDGISYDYRVSEDQTIVVLCSTQDAPVDGQPTAVPAPRVIQMTDPALAIAPLTGAPGTTVDLIANSFPPSSSVLIGIGEVDSEYEVVQTLQTSAEGALAATITIPDTFTAGQQVVVVVETEDNALRVVSPVFVVSSVGAPSVILDPQTGAPGSEVQLTATGYPPNTSVLIGVGPQNAEDFTYSLRETTDAQGSLVTNITIPAEAPIDQPYIALVQVEADRSFEAISNPFLPTGVAPTPDPDGGEATSADMYLIATGDAGQSGVPVGCDDSAVPVQVVFEPTITPLTDALEQLLALDTETYGQSGLYNALYQSDLSIQGIDIDEGVATINLTGNIVLGGTCDAPRVEAQIEQTALQFATVQSVNIFVNGQPLADVTSSQ